MRRNSAIAGVLSPIWWVRRTNSLLASCTRADGAYRSERLERIAVVALLIGIVVAIGGVLEGAPPSRGRNIQILKPFHDYSWLVGLSCRSCSTAGSHSPW